MTLQNFSDFRMLEPPKLVIDNEPVKRQVAPGCSTPPTGRMTLQNRWPHGGANWQPWAALGNSPLALWRTLLTQRAKTGGQGWG